MDQKEFEIPVPWGHIAIKTWGDEKNTPVLTVHGWADNLGTFDRLIPYLSTSFYYICIDLPSHGKSSRYPPHTFVTALNNVMTVKMVVDYLNRKKYIYMGHSWGGNTGILFTQLYPEYIVKLILFDSFHFFPVELETFKDYLKDRLDTLIKINENVAQKNERSLTYEEAVTKLMHNRQGTLHRVSAEALVNRYLIPVQDGTYLSSNDPRLKIYMNPLFDMNYLIQIAKKYFIKCPVLLVYASESRSLYNKYKGVLEEFQKKNSNYNIVEVTGSHAVHSNNPEIVSPFVNKFLTSISSSKL